MSLEKCGKDIPEFSLCGQSLKGKVVEMYDADTCKIVLPLNNTLYKFTCRLNGIDAPEMKPNKEKPNRTIGFHNWSCPVLLIGVFLIFVNLVNSLYKNEAGRFLLISSFVGTKKQVLFKIGSIL